MKKFIIFTAVVAVFCLSFTTHSDASVVPKAPKPRKGKVAIRKQYTTFPTGMTWTIAYFPNTTMLSLNWQVAQFDNPHQLTASFTFEGNTQTVDPHATSYVLWAGSTYTLIPNQSYTMFIGQVPYYFYWDGSSNYCTITSHG